MQIRRQLAIGIVSRQFPLNEPLPSIRRLASDLKVSVTTVTMVYKSLVEDGFVISRKRSGHFVNPDVLAGPGHRAEVIEPPADRTPASRVDYVNLFRGRSFNRERVAKPSDSLVRYRYPFVCGLIDPSLFPLARWRECVRDAVNVVGVANCATDFSETDDQVLVEHLIQRVLGRRGIFGAARRGARDDGRPAGPLHRHPAPAGAGRDDRRRGSRLPGCRQHGENRRDQRPAASRRRRGVGPLRATRRVQVPLRHAEPPVPDDRHDAAGAQVQAPGAHPATRPVRHRGRLRIRDQLQQDPPKGPEEAWIGGGTSSTWAACRSRCCRD